MHFFLAELDAHVCERRAAGAICWACDLTVHIGFIVCQPDLAVRTAGRVIRKWGMAVDGLDTTSYLVNKVWLLTDQCACCTSRPQA